jgi:hypothetical protein
VLGSGRGQLQVTGQVAGVDAGEQLDEAEDVALAAPGGDVELGLGEARHRAAGVVDGGAVVFELAGELADRGCDRFRGCRACGAGAGAGYGGGMCPGVRHQ